MAVRIITLGMLQIVDGEMIWELMIIEISKEGRAICYYKPIV